jgi:hypothetical protein
MLQVTAIFYLNEGWQPHHGGQLKLFPWPRAEPLLVAPLAGRLVLFSSTEMLHRVLPAGAERCCFTAWLSDNRRRAAAGGARCPAPARLPAAGWRVPAPAAHLHAAALPGPCTEGAPPPRPSHPDPAHSLRRRRPGVGAAPAARGSLRPPAPSEGPGPQARFIVQPQARRHLCKLVYADEWAQSLQESHPAGPALEAALAQHWQEVKVVDRALGGALVAFAELAAGGTGSGSVDDVGQGGGRLQLGQRVLGQLRSCVAGRGGVPVQWFV